MSGSKTSPSDSKTTCGSSRNNDENATVSGVQMATEIYRKTPFCIKEHIMHFALSGEKDCSCGAPNDQSEKYKEAIDQLFALPPCVQTHILYLAFQEATSKGHSKRAHFSSTNTGQKCSSETTGSSISHTNSSSKHREGSSLSPQKQPSSSHSHRTSSLSPQVAERQHSSNIHRIHHSTASSGVEHTHKSKKSHSHRHSHASKLAETQPCSNSRKDSKSSPSVDQGNKSVEQRRKSATGRSSFKIEDMDVVLEIKTIEKYTSAHISKSRIGPCSPDTCEGLGYKPSGTSNSSSQKSKSDSNQTLDNTLNISSSKFEPLAHSSALDQTHSDQVTKAISSTTKKSLSDAGKQKPDFECDCNDITIEPTKAPCEPELKSNVCDPSSCDKTTNKIIVFKEPSFKVYPDAYCTNCDKTTCEETMHDYLKARLSVKQKKSKKRTTKPAPGLIPGTKEANICEPGNCDNRDAEVILINKIMCGEVENIDPQEVKKLVEKENEDCDIFLSPTPPYIALNPGSFTPKKKLQNMHASVSTPYPQLFSSADGAQYEPTPESYVQIMQLIEANCDPVIAPNVNFNTLFNSSVVGDPVPLSPVAEGYFQDVMVPIKEPKGIQYELINKDVMEISKRLFKESKLNPIDSPKDNLFVEKKPDFQVNPENMDTQLDLKQEPPWKDIDLGPSVKALGAQPLNVICVTDVKELEEGALKSEMQKGMDYYIETRAPLYTSHVQLRGSEPPKSFPGYGFIVPYANVTQLARSPSVVFRKAWQSAKPKNFNDKSIIRVNNKSFV